MRVVIPIFVVCFLVLVFWTPNNEMDNVPLNSIQVKVLASPVQDYKLEVKSIEAQGGLDFSITLEVIEFYRVPIKYTANMPAVARVSISGLECHLASYPKHQTAVLYYFFTDGKWKEARAKLSEASVQKGSRIRLKVEEVLESDPKNTPAGDLVKIRGNQNSPFCFL